MTPATAQRAPRRRKTRLSATLERRNAVAMRHRHYVEKIARQPARRLPSSSTEPGDLVPAGALRLLEAAARFDPTRGQSFEAPDTMSRVMRRTWRDLEAA